MKKLLAFIFGAILAPLIIIVVIYVAEYFQPRYEMRKP